MSCAFMYDFYMCSITLRISTIYCFFFFLMIRRPPRSTLDRSSAASDVYKRQELDNMIDQEIKDKIKNKSLDIIFARTRPEHKLRLVSLFKENGEVVALSLIHISEPTRPY